MDTRLRIGELAQRTGVSTHVLRVWEDRHQLLSPRRTANGYRSYTAEDEQRVREMVRLREKGVGAPEAAAQVLSAALGRSRPRDLEVLLGDLLAAWASYDEATAHAVIDAALVGHPLEDVLTALFFPALRQLGEAWQQQGRVTIAQEHYASSLVRGRMLALGPELSRAARVEGAQAPLAVLACPSDERHDIGLLALDLLLRRDGWQVTFLGADTPVPAVVRLARELDADLVVLCGTEPEGFAAQLEQHADDLAALPHRTALALGGAGAERAWEAGLGATLLDADPVAAAHAMTARFARSSRAAR